MPDEHEEEKTGTIIMSDKSMIPHPKNPTLEKKNSAEMV